MEEYLGSGFGGVYAYIPVDAPRDLIQLWQNDFQAPILDGLQQVDPHTPAHAGGHSNDTQFVTEQSNGNHNTTYQLNGEYQNLAPNTTIDFETPWGLLSSFKNTEEASSSEPASEPTEGEGTEGEECDCACGEGLSPVLTAIHTYEIWDDGGTPEFPDDDVLIGYAVTEFYGEPWGNTTIYDMDGNEIEPNENGEYPPQYNAQNSDWRLINAENFGTAVDVLANEKPLAEPKEPEYQISQIAQAIGNIIGSLPEYFSGHFQIGDNPFKIRNRILNNLGQEDGLNKIDEDYKKLKQLIPDLINLENAVFKSLDNMKSLNRFFVDSLPLIGTTLGTIEAITGKDAFSGEELSDIDRAIATVATTISLVPIGTLAAFVPKKQILQMSAQLAKLTKTMKDKGINLSKKTLEVLEKAIYKLKCAFKEDEWSRAPKSLQDQMTLEAAKEGAGTKIIENLGNPLYKGWEKWEYKIKSADGKDSVVHYVRNPKTGRITDFKFKKHSTEYDGDWVNTPEKRVRPYGNN